MCLQTTKGIFQNNYALESFGSGARCFGQADKWEQRSCTMVKQWNRWDRFFDRDSFKYFQIWFRLLQLYLCCGFASHNGSGHLLLLWIPRPENSYSTKGKNLLYFQLYPLSNVFLMTDHTSLQMDSWIHSGSVVCPSCSSLCADCSLEGITSEVKSYLPMIPDIDVNYDHDQLIHGWSPKRLSNRSDMIMEMEHSKRIKDANRLKCAKKLEERHLIKII